MSLSEANPLPNAQAGPSVENLQRQVQELEARLAQATAERAAAYDELDDLARFLSHDLRAPLRGIDGYSQALMEDYSARLDAIGMAYLQFIFEASRQAASLIDKLIYYLRIPRAELNPQTIDLSRLAEDLLQELQNAQPERTVKCEITPGLVVVGDAKMTRELLRNLLDNAWKFTRQRLSGRIELGQAHSETGALFFIRDNGAGFNMDYQDHLFQPFQRLHSSHEFDGVGMGLAIARRIVERHGGGIWAQAAVDKGATFYFTLPHEGATTLYQTRSAL